MQDENSTPRVQEKDSFVVTFSVRKVQPSGRVLGCDYRVRPLTPDPEVARHAWRFRKLDDQGKPTHESYDLKMDPSGTVTCECMGYLGWGYCKHSDCVRVFLGLPPLRPRRAGESQVSG
jgi:hypothetical protein